MLSSLVSHIFGITRNRLLHIIVTITVNKGNNKITELQAILQRESQNS